MGVISFPGLGNISFHINRIAFSLFGLSIHWYGIIIAAGFLLAVLLALKNCKKYDIDPDNIIDLVLYAAPISIITARLYYVIFSSDKTYLENPLEIAKIWHGGLAIFGGIIGAVATTFVFCKIKKINAWNLLDLGLPYFALAQAIGRWGNFVNQEAFGSQTNLPWGMTGDQIKKYIERNYPNLDPNVPVHPTFLYESLWNIGLFVFLVWFRKRKKVDGEIFFLYMIFYGIGRMWIEGLRTDSLMLGSLRVSQILSVIIAIVGCVAFFWRRKLKSGKEAGLAYEPSGYEAVLEELRDNNKNETGDNNEVLNNESIEVTKEQSQNE
ncbi:MAG: prolipoprotein diacylglyceryl transferase [Bacillota bacterium]|nr:prolipoprotein diacylglyceryl transferase [Bacillota bacterium]